MRIGIIGAGHAGVEAATAAVESGAETTLFSAESVLPYYRPRLPAIAFGQAEFPSIRMHQEGWYPDHGINLLLNSRVEEFDSKRMEIVAGGYALRFDGLVVACGARPILPPFSSNAPAAILPLWNIRHAEAIRQRVSATAGIVIVGGGILGIEAALLAADAGMQVNIVERTNRLMPAQIGIHASAFLFQRLSEKGITVLLERTVTQASATPDNGVRLSLNDGRSLNAALCLVCAGASPDDILPHKAELRTESGVVANSQLQTSCPTCFGAGDIVKSQGITRRSAPEALKQGRIAGTNVVAFLKGQPLRTYEPELSPLAFRFENFEIRAFGAPGGTGCDERRLSGASETAFRCLVMRNGKLAGVHMIGTSEGFNGYVADIKAAHAER